MNQLDAEHYRLHAEVCKVLTDPKRLMLIDALADGERSVGELAAALGITLANASQHLGVMRHAGLVETRREGTTIVYRLSQPDIVEACRIIDRLVARQRPATRQARLPIVAGTTAGSLQAAGAAITQRS